MKTLSLVVVGMLVLSVSVLSARGVVDEQQNARDIRFMLAGTILKNEAESTLTAKAEYASQYFTSMVPRRGIAIGKPSFVELENRVNDFLETKESYNERLGLYGLYTTTEIDSDLVRIVRVYFRNEKFFYGDDYRETIRKKISEKTGSNVFIKNGFSRHIFPTLAYLVFSFLLSLLFFLIGDSIKNDLGRKLISFGLPACIVSAFLIFYFFAG
ncbi:MAG: hypothetical protein AAB631_00960 [Patescibacteria group bacterium]